MKKILTLGLFSVFLAGIFVQGTSVSAYKENLTNNVEVKKEKTYPYEDIMYGEFKKNTDLDKDGNLMYGANLKLNKWYFNLNKPEKYLNGKKYKVFIEWTKKNHFSFIKAEEILNNVKYKTKEEAIRMEGNKCNTLSNGINNFFGKDFMLSTRIAEPEGFIPEWSCINYKENFNNKDNIKLVGNDRDKNGCINSAGYIWSAKMEKCIRPWETETKDLKICTTEYNPMCGIDGKTYGNKCNLGEVELAYKGECTDVETMNKQIIEYGKELNMKDKNIVKAFETKIQKISLEKTVKERKSFNEKIINIIDKTINNLYKSIDSLMYSSSNESKLEIEKKERIIKILNYIKLSTKKDLVSLYN